MSSGGGHGEGDGASQNEWLRDGLNLDPPRSVPGPPSAPRGRSWGRRLAIGGGLVAAGVVAAAVVPLTTLYGDAGDPPAAPATGTPSPSSAGPAPDTTPAPDTGATPPPPAPPPRGGGTADLVLPDRLYVLEPLTRDDPFATSLLTACAGGDRGGCTQLLDLLAQDCLDGDLAACDGLYAVTPVGSPFEEVAATCGHRFPDASSAGRCSGE